MADALGDSAADKEPAPPLFLSNLVFAPEPGGAGDRDQTLHFLVEDAAEHEPATGRHGPAEAGMSATNVRLSMFATIPSNGPMAATPSAATPRTAMPTRSATPL